MLRELENTKNLTIEEAMVEDLIVNDDSVNGVVFENGNKCYSKAVILTTGTYLNSKILVGDTLSMKVHTESVEVKI